MNYICLFRATSKCMKTLHSVSTSTLPSLLKLNLCKIPEKLGNKALSKAAVNYTITKPAWLITSGKRQRSPGSLPGQRAQHATGRLGTTALIFLRATGSDWHRMGNGDRGKTLRGFNRVIDKFFLLVPFVLCVSFNLVYRGVRFNLVQVPPAPTSPAGSYNCTAV